MSILKTSLTFVRLADFFVWTVMTVDAIVFIINAVTENIWQIVYEAVWGYICYDLAESVGSWEQWLLDVARKRNEFLFVFCCFNYPSIAHNHWSDSGGVFSKMHFSNWALQSNRKLKLSHVSLQTDFPRSHHNVSFFSFVTIYFVWNSYSVNVLVKVNCLSIRVNIDSGDRTICISAIAAKVMLR